jgi:hypothetical protein
VANRTTQCHPFAAFAFQAPLFSAVAGPSANDTKPDTRCNDGGRQLRAAPLAVFLDAAIDVLGIAQVVPGMLIWPIEVQQVDHRFTV